ncbi:hypothetical protein DENSPDRAFT_283520 [Dentipellis sp. KUC8613]|nr:hypothetical protein DENSPDRAFT_283520 [Dentipellis sp. KUC8613]
MEVIVHTKVARKTAALLVGPVYIGILHAATCTSTDTKRCWISTLFRSSRPGCMCLVSSIYRPLFPPSRALFPSSRKSSRLRESRPKIYGVVWVSHIHRHSKPLGIDMPTSFCNRWKLLVILGLWVRLSSISAIHADVRRSPTDSSARGSNT